MRLARVRPGAGLERDGRLTSGTRPEGQAATDARASHLVHAFGPRTRTCTRRPRPPEFAGSLPGITVSDQTVTQPISDGIFVTFPGRDADHQVLASSIAGFSAERQPLRLMNARSDTKTARLLPSSKGWFLTRRTMSTAALSTKSG